MTVYVDDMRAPFGRMIMCHMVADTHTELNEMADNIGVARKWIQNPGNHGEHYDISLSKKALAIKFGAKEITAYEAATMCAERRGAKGNEAYYGQITEIITE